ncbi:MAG: hypothetical protein HOB79_18070 [Rhodospirillaceae bacterium]|jgi:hypothetical protein|nr:hypothetical protein [Rhodospirillales bacterium]MBT3904906.1 hypothetical protein [Rhodospirillaceae bacterium]MBT4702983.1 hypothetical protein [Rhodospirillaceae bacterium]MBT5033028.1 hypothetical protein [Rhodospirillaceae bacterium]MBT6218095.1 hypothetical protein [Rhodospirillaceae bacterium]
MRFVLMAVLFLSVGACTEVHYVEEPLVTGQPAPAPKVADADDELDEDAEGVEGIADEGGQEASGLFSRTVNYKLADAFYQNPPRCVMVAPIMGKGMTEAATLMIEAAISRHASQRVDRVIEAHRAYRKLRAMALDIKNQKHLRRLARSFNCDAIMTPETKGAQGAYAVVFAQVSFGLKLTLTRASDGEVMWRGAHQASRSGGGVPLGLLGIPIIALKAGRFSSDTDVLPSMVDDVTRRIFASLPNMRIVR